jgi:hypothetical protein
MFFIESVLPSFRHRKHRYWGPLLRTGSKDSLVALLSFAYFGFSRYLPFMVLSVCAYKKNYKLASAVCNYTESRVAAPIGEPLLEGGHETRD